MKISIYSRAEMEKQLKKGLPEDTAVISFYDPENADRDYSPVDYSGQPIRLFRLPLYDIDLSALKRYGMRYSDYFPQADELARFILHAVNDNCSIICQCEYGQSRSAACAAAILEHFEKNGISIFVDDAYLPNQMVFNKLMKALEREHKQPTLSEVRRTMSTGIYYSYIESAESLSRDGMIDEALTQLNMLLQIVSSDMGQYSMYTAAVYYYIADTYYRSEMYTEAVLMHKKAAEICILNEQNRAVFRIHRCLAKAYLKMNDTEKAVSVCGSELEYQQSFGDRKYILSAQLLLGDVLFSAQRYSEAILQWKSTDSSSESVLRRIAKGYAALGDKENAFEYSLRAQDCPDCPAYNHRKSLAKYKQEIDNIKTEIGEI